MEKRDVKDIEALVKSIGGVSFVSITYRNQNGEKARYVVNLGIEHKKVLTKDLERLPKVREQLYPVLSEKFGVAVTDKAFAEIEKSIRTSLDGTNKNSNAQKEAYVWANQGMKFGIATRRLYIYAYKVSKVTLEKGEYPTVNSRPLTLCKREIDKKLKRNNYRQFIIEEDQLEKMVTGGNTLEFNLV